MRPRRRLPQGRWRQSQLRSRSGHLAAYLNHRALAVFGGARRLLAKGDVKLDLCAALRLVQTRRARFEKRLDGGASLGHPISVSSTRRRSQHTRRAHGAEHLLVRPDLAAHRQRTSSLARFGCGQSPSSGRSRNDCDWEPGAPYIQSRCHVNIAPIPSLLSSSSSVIHHYQSQHLWNILTENVRFERRARRTRTCGSLEFKMAPRSRSSTSVAS